MPFVTLSNAALNRIPHLEGAPSYVHFGNLQLSGLMMISLTDHGIVDTFGTPQASGVQDPLTGSLFYIDSTDDNQELRPYNYDETGVVLKGSLHSFCA